MWGLKMRNASILGDLGSYSSAINGIGVNTLNLQHVSPRRPFSKHNAISNSHLPGCDSFIKPHISRIRAAHAPHRDFSSRPFSRLGIGLMKPPACDVCHVRKVKVNTTPHGDMPGAGLGADERLIQAVFRR